ncbi:nitroreductase family deazaflavin-dependent oxidoreductase [Lentzea sp. NPDC042327]|uniref:nitroreductase family deazaflavin-dependent oxidoreductase n=1 Tax=Lentzea sp. NPDC042327 TaxID=3154801 RepID=UPI003401CF10
MALARWLGEQRWLANLRPIVMAFDRALYRVSGGRVMTTSFSGQKGLTLISTGARSGQRRETPVQYVPDGDSVLVAGTNWGRPDHPAWTANLLKNPDAQTNVRGTIRPVRARLLEGAERDEAWGKMLAVWPAFDGYVTRSGRTPRVFRLVPASG